MERINILWTGGFDSTFRICQLSLLDVEIQPYYISFEKKSEPNELKSIDEITKYLRARIETKCILLPVKIIKQQEILKDRQITESYFALFKEAEFGDQYVWLSSFARQYNLKLEVGFEVTPSSNANLLIHKYGVMIKRIIPTSGNDTIGYCELDPAKSNSNLYNLFGMYCFGLPLFHMTKLEILEVYKKDGFENVIPLTWFCAFPVNGKPCGLCSPCETVMKAGLGFRIPFMPRMLYKVFKENPVGRKLENKLKTVYNKHLRKLEISA